MLTKIEIRNFKRFSNVMVDLDQVVVFIGPNNMGKTTALQALALWDIGLHAWLEKYGELPNIPKKRPVVTINRKDISAIPVPNARFLWENLHVRNTKPGKDGVREKQNIAIEIVVYGITEDHQWSCGFEFDYANQEALYCRPLSTENGRMEVPDAAKICKTAFLPPMSGLSDREFIKQPGEIDTLIGEGQTAQVLRNLCYDVVRKSPEKWEMVVRHIQKIFGVALKEPKVVRDKITLGYEGENKEIAFDISCSGRGMQQTLLLLIFLYAHPGSSILLDEPDAHLEILRQRQIFALLTDVATELGSQIIAASHSEVVLNEAAARGSVVAFAGVPHVMANKSQLFKSLSSYGFEEYYKAEQTGWVLYLEDTTDLDILKTFAKKLNHEAVDYLENRPFFHPLCTNLPNLARDHFHALKEAKNDLRGIAIFDHLDKNLAPESSLVEVMWEKREIENYFCKPEILLRYSDTLERAKPEKDLFTLDELEPRSVRADMELAINELTSAIKIQRKDPWSPDFKVTDDFLDPLFKNFSDKRKIPLVLRKNAYYKLAELIKREEIDDEISVKLDLIVDVAKSAHPCT